jgi:hypothetical protein
VGKAKRLHLGRLLHYPQTRLERLARDKHTSLLRTFVNYVRKKFYNIGARRKKHGVDKILSEYQLPEVVRKYFPGGWHLHDNEERPLFILRLGQMDVKGIIKVKGSAASIRLTTFNIMTILSTVGGNQPI